MANQKPPPLPAADQPFRTYLWAFVMLMPTIFIWLFASTYLLPKLEQIWQVAGLSGSRAQWLLDASVGFKAYFHLIVSIVVVLILLLEFKWSAWPRYRSVAIGAFTVLINTAVLVGITAIATSGLLAAPLLTRPKAPKVIAEEAK